MSRSVHLVPKRIQSYFSGRRGWFWTPVSFVGACSTVASSLPFMGAYIVWTQEERLALSIFLICGGLVVMLGPIVLMAAIVDSVRPWVDPNYNQPPTGAGVPHPRRRPSKNGTARPPPHPRTSGIPLVPGQRHRPYHRQLLAPRQHHLPHVLPLPHLSPHDHPATHELRRRLPRRDHKTTGVRLALQHPRGDRPSPARGRSPRDLRPGPALSQKRRTPHGSTSGLMRVCVHIWTQTR